MATEKTETVAKTTRRDREKAARLEAAAQRAIERAVAQQEETKRARSVALQEVATEKNIPLDELVKIIEGALVSAYKRAYGGTGAVRIQADLATNEFKVYARKLIVQTISNANTEIAWREARKQDAMVNLGDQIEVEVTPADFGRLAASTARQVFSQRTREAERVQVASEYSDKTGQMYRGIVQRLERGNVVVQVGKAEAILPRREQVEGEHYRFNDAIYVYVVEVRPGYRGPSITVSRTHPGLVRQLFELEVPEISEGIVEIRAVAREAGSRSKIAVAAQNPDVDPVGACVGPRGLRVGKVVNELGNEKVDIVRWHDDPILLITNALSPSQIAKVILTQDAEGKKKDGALGTATVIVAEDQQSLAIGKQGQNVRLAAKLTGWRIDIRTEKQFAEEQAKRMFLSDIPVAPRAMTVRESASELDAILPLSLADEDEPNDVQTEETGEAETPLGSAAPDNDVAETSTETLFTADALPTTQEAMSVDEDEAAAEV